MIFVKVDKIYYVLIIWLFQFFLLSTKTYANSLNLNQCYMPWEYGDSEKEKLIIRPIGEKCYTICQNQCREFFKDNMFSSVGFTGTELNTDLIDQCLSKCQKGEIFSSRYRISDNSSKNILGWKWSDKKITTNTACATDPNDEESAEYAYFSSNFLVKNGDKIHVSLIDPNTGYQNTVFLCGFNSIRITPNVWGGVSNNISGKDLAWSPANKNWFDTSLSIKKGDYLKISYGGRFIGQFDGINSAPSSLDLNLLFDGSCDGKNVFPGNEVPACYNLKTNPKSSYCISENNKTVACSDNNGVSNNNCNSIHNNMYKNNKFCSLNISHDISVRKEISLNDKYQNDYVINKLKFEGYLGNLKLNSNSLKILYDRLSYDENYLGGYEVEILKRGCPYRDGEALEYAIIPDTTDKKTGLKLYSPEKQKTWNSVKEIINNHILAKTHGKIFFRINPEKIPSKRAETLGAYGIVLNKEETIHKVASTIISDLINKIRKFFISDDSNDKYSGKVQYIFNKLITDKVFINSIIALLILYISYTGLSYIIGIAKITQTDALIRILKISLIITLISPTSWKFFNENLFRLFLHGGLTLTYDIVQPITNTKAFNIENVTTTELTEIVFGMYDQVFHQIFNKTIWIKIWALVCTNLIGIFLALLIAIALIEYIICVIKAVIIYLLSIITLYILFLLSPILISCMLFKKTTEIGKSGFNNMLAMMLQPMFIFVAVAFLHGVFIAVLYTSLSFTACPTCILSFQILEWDICIPGNYVWWVALYGSHFPIEASMSSPLHLLPPIVAMLVLAQAMNGLVNIMSDLANRVATNSFYGFDLGGIAGGMQNYIVTSIEKTGKTVFRAAESNFQKRQSSFTRRNNINTDNSINPGGGQNDDN